MRAMPLPVGERVYQLKVTLRHTRPPVWRRLQVRGDTTLGQLNRYLQVAMGWWNSHLHLFQIGRTEYRQPDPEEDVFWEITAKDENAAVLGEVVRAGKEDSATFTTSETTGNIRLWWRRSCRGRETWRTPCVWLANAPVPPRTAAGPGDTGNSCRH